MIFFDKNLELITKQKVNFNPGKFYENFEKLHILLNFIPDENFDFNFSFNTGLKEKRNVFGED